MSEIVQHVHKKLYSKGFVIVIGEIFTITYL